MSIPLVLSVARYLTHIPGWVIITYVSIAVIMAVALLVQFLMHARTRHGAWLILLILFFPLMALSIVWPVTLPFTLYALRNDRQRKPQGFPVVPRR